MENEVYLDWAATTPLSEEAAKAMAPFMVPGPKNLPAGGNANSLHSPGRKAFALLEDARMMIARCVGASRSDEIVFTSGATEANNTALLGIVSAFQKHAAQTGKANFKPHVITSKIEHDAILAPARVLESLGCELSYLEPDNQGHISVEKLEEALQENTVLVSIHMVNNEIGAVQDIAGLSKAAHKAGSYFHTDAVQALGKEPIDLHALDVDAASFSAHKIGGPKGVGVLYLKNGTLFSPSMIGGGQEGGKRSGTQNVCGAVGMAAACTMAHKELEKESDRLRDLRDRVFKALTNIKGVHPSVVIEKGSRAFAPHVVNVWVEGFESETMILRMDMKGFAISGGSACSSHSLEPSHVLKALGLPPEKALGSVRVSLGRYTKLNDVDRFIEAFEECLQY